MPQPLQTATTTPPAKIVPTPPAKPAAQPRTNGFSFEESQSPVESAEARSRRGRCRRPALARALDEARRRAADACRISRRWEKGTAGAPGFS